MENLKNDDIRKILNGLAVNANYGMNTFKYKGKTYSVDDINRLQRLHKTKTGKIY